LIKTYATASLNALSGENFGTFFAFIFISSPVLGFRPVLPFLLLTLKVPNPDRVTSPFFLRVFVMVSRIQSTAAWASFFVPSNEASNLVDVGGIAFGVELILNNAQSTAEQSLIIPDILYLDASVLMPAIVEGHPYGPIYFDTVTRLQDIANQSQVQFRVCTADIFLDEMVHHRASAQKEVQELGLEDPEKLHRHILFCGASNTNVYIGSYASWVGRNRERIPFSKFLTMTAPYATEESLAQYLGKIGIYTVKLSFKALQEKILYNNVKAALYSAYEQADALALFSSKKPAVLIEHEVAQLTQMLIDMQTRKKPLFVTADKRLMSLLRHETISPCAKVTVSHLGLIQLIDLVIGLARNADKRSLARLMWSIDISDETMPIRNYLIDLALQYYDEATTMAMWQVVDTIAEKAAHQAKEEGIPMYKRLDTGTDKARLAAFLDRFEDDFFRKMDEVITAKEKKQE
jgi:hypothetical protein